MISDFLHTESGSAISSVIIVSVLILAIVTIVIQTFNTSNKLWINRYNSIRAIYDAESNSRLMLDNLKTLSELYQTQINEENQIVQLGGFLKTVNSVADCQLLEQLFGQQVFSNQLPAIVLFDSTTGLNLSGSTSITGDIISARNEVRNQSYKGVPFSGQFNGVIRTIRAFIKIEYQAEFIMNQIRNLNHVIGNNDFFPTTQLNDQELNYFNKTVSIRASEPKVLNHLEQIIVDGNLSIQGEYTFPDYTQIIVSDTLFIDGSISGEHLFIYGGKHIEVSGSSQMSVQLISEGNISISDDTYLVYPSLVFSAKQFADENQRIISISDKAMVEGTVMYPFQPDAFSLTNLRIYIGNEAKVKGLVFTKGLTELSGTVQGTVMTNQFYFYDSPTTYFNWLKDATIDADALPSEFVTPLGFGNKPRFKLIDWHLTAGTHEE